MNRGIVTILLFIVLGLSAIADDQKTESILQNISGQDFKSSLLVAPSNGNFPCFIGFSQDRAYLEIRDDNDRSKVVAVQWTFIKELDEKFIADLKERHITAVKRAFSANLDHLVYVDMFAPDYTTQHPLIGRSVGGRDIAFRHTQSGETIHAVFPQDVSVPENFNGHFELHGHYRETPKESPTKEQSPVKKIIPEGYRYFVVSSWKQKK